MHPLINKLIRSLLRQSSKAAESAELEKEKLTSVRAKTALRKAATEKEKQLAHEAASRAVANTLESVRKLLPAIAIAYGFLVTFLYFFRAIGFFPSGLTLGDTVLFVFVALGFGLFGFVFVGAGSFNILPALAYRAGAKAAGRQDERSHEAIFAIFSSTPFSISACALLWLAGKAHETWFESGNTFFWVHLAIAVLLGVLIAWSNWMYGARGMLQRTPMRSIMEWLFEGVGYGFFYLFVAPWAVLAFPTYMPLAVLLSFGAGFFMWLGIDGIGKGRRPRGAATEGDKARAEATGHGVVSPETKGQRSTARRVGVALAALLLICGSLAAYNSWFDAAFAIAAVLLVVLSVAYVVRSIASNPKSAEVPKPSAREDMDASNVKDTEEKAAGYRRLYSGFLLGVAALGVPLYGDMFQFDAKLSTAVFRSLGLRIDDATVKLKGDGLSLVMAEATAAGIDLNVCAEPDGTALVSPVNVLWHGMGKRSWLSIGKVPERRSGEVESRGTEIEVASNELKVLRNASTRCRDMTSKVFFPSGSAQISDEQTAALADELSSVLSASGAFPPAPSASASWAWRLDKVIVTGHADAMPLSDNGNEALAKRRAACVAAKVFRVSLKGKRPLDDYRLTWSGSGAREQSKPDCPVQGPRGALIECNAINRAVKVRVVISCERLEHVENDKSKLNWRASRACIQAEIAGQRTDFDNDTKKLPKPMAAAASAAERADSQCSSGV